jgi:5'-3' exoribonuclease 1
MAPSILLCRADAAKVTFNLLHLSLVREYTQIEFGMDAAGVDFERVIDDWVLLLYLVGNDFIPHLPNLHIDKVRA